VNIPRSSPMEGEHTPTIIQLIRSTDLVVIQFKDSHIFFIFPTKVSEYLRSPRFITDKSTWWLFSL